MKLRLLLLALCLPALTALHADDYFARRFAPHLGEALEHYNHEMPFQCLAELYCQADVDGDTLDELLLAEKDTTRVAAYKVIDGVLRPVAGTAPANANWTGVKWFYTCNDIDYDTDITLRYRPVFIENVDKAKNRFSTSSETWSRTVDPQATYDRMIFKPHVGNIKRVGNKVTGKEVIYTWALTDPAQVAKMFRGYSDPAACPIVVPREFLDSHTPLQYSRWLTGEPERQASPDACRIISSFYGGRRIVGTKWLASYPDAERHFYQVLFAPENHTGLMATVCVAEGEVVSAHNTFMPLDNNDSNTVGWGDSYNVEDQFYHAPEIMAMMACDEGLELYVRWPSYEGIHYSIWREVQGQWLILQDDYQYLTAY